MAERLYYVSINKAAFRGMHLIPLGESSMEWLDPWWPTDDQNTHFHEIFLKQLQLEVGPRHQMFGLRVRLIGRGNGDDALFEILDGSGRVAVVHLTWSKVPEDPPWPGTIIYPNLASFVMQRMNPDHEEWLAD